MTNRTVLIAAFSGRALAQSARRAGFVPLVVDSFGDLDTRSAAEHYAGLPGAVRNGFTAKALIPTLDALASKATTTPVGIVLGSGFEDRPKLISVLDKRYRLLGTNADIVSEVKDPRAFATLLKQLKIAHPETHFELPQETGSWLAKRAGGAGGAHIRNFSTERTYSRRHYFQRRLEGVPHSVFAISSKGGVALELSRQWTTPSPTKPCRYGGAAIIEYDDGNAAHRKMVEAAATLIELLDPAGLVSFDFLVSDGEPYLLEINPRPGATLDIFDDTRGNLFRAHIEAGLGNELWQQREPLNLQSRASAILYADQGALIAPAIDWPEWSADRPAPGTHIPAEAPLATVFAGGASTDEAERLARQRLSELARLVYTSDQSTKP